MTDSTPKLTPLGPALEKRSRQLAQSSAMSIAFDNAMVSEGQTLLRALLGEIDLLRGDAAEWRRSTSVSVRQEMAANADLVNGWSEYKARAETLEEEKRRLLTDLSEITRQRDRLEVDGVELRQILDTINLACRTNNPAHAADKLALKLIRAEKERDAAVTAARDHQRLGLLWTERLRMAGKHVERLRFALQAALATWCERDPGGDGADGETYHLCRDVLTETDYEERPIA
jgi:hypothetical protein